MRRRLLPLFIILYFSGIVYAESGEEVLDKKITLIVEQKEVKVVLNDISKLAKIKFVYSPQRIPSRKKVTLRVYDQKVSEVLNLLLGPLDVLYYVSGSQVVLMKKGEEGEILLKLKDQEEEKPITKEVFFKTITGKITNEKW